MFRGQNLERDAFSTAELYPAVIGEDSFYMFLARQGRKFFRDRDFADFYHPTMGRPSVPPSILMRTLLLQMYDRVSDEEATRRVRTDLAWKAALNLAPDEVPFRAKSTLVLFRAKLLASGRARELFERAVREIEAAYNLKKRGPAGGKQIALDTTPVFGRGAVKDVFNLLADLVKQIVIHVATALEHKPADWARRNGFGQYFGKSFKGMCRINWDDPEEREKLLAQVLADARRIQQLAREVMERGKHRRLSQRHQEELEDRLGLLEEIVIQNVEQRADGSVKVKQGMARDRIVSTTAPEMRHGRKSTSQRFDGYKLAVAVDVETQLITAVEVLPANAHDSAAAEPLVEGTERATGQKVTEIIGDSAFGDARSRARWQERGMRVTAKVPKVPPGERFGKEDFELGPDEQWLKCPAGRVTYKWYRSRVKIGGNVYETKRFVFPAEWCSVCPLRSRCVREPCRRGRVVTLHPFESLLRAARREQETEAFRQRYRKRLVVEHRIARLIQLGMRQARYFGRRKVLLQALLTAMVANLSLFWSFSLAETLHSSLSFVFLAGHLVMIASAAALLRQVPLPVTLRQAL